MKRGRRGRTGGDFPMEGWEGCRLRHRGRCGEGFREHARSKEESCSDERGMRRQGCRRVRGIGVGFVGGRVVSLDLVS